MSNHFQPFPAIPCIFMHFQPFPVISSHPNYFQTCSTLPAISSNFQPFPVISSRFSHFQLFLDIYSYFQQFPASRVKLFTIISHYFQPFPVISSHFQPFQPIPVIRSCSVLFTNIIIVILIKYLFLNELDNIFTQPLLRGRTNKQESKQTHKNGDSVTTKKYINSKQFKGVVSFRFYGDQ